MNNISRDIINNLKDKLRANNIFRVKHTFT
jgi:hypothetical protein